MTSSTPPIRTSTASGDEVAELQAQVRELVGALDRTDRFVRKLQDDPLIVSRVDGAPRYPYPLVIKSPNGLKKYVLVRSPGGGAEFHELTKDDPAPQDSDWDDFGLSASFASYLEHFNGTFADSFDATTSESGGVVTLSLEQTGGGDLTMRFHEGLSTLDCTPAATIALTVGSDTAPQVNYIYVPQSTKVLTKSTSGFPTDAEHIKVAFLFVPSATFVQNNGVYVNQNWNDHAHNGTDMGHMAHLAERERRTSATWFSGVDGAGTSGYLTLGGTTVDLKMDEGVIYQMHRHDFEAFDTSTGGLVLVPNWNGDAYHDITNLYDIVADSGGNTIGTNKYFNLTIWAVANKAGEFHQVMINLPSGFYNTLSGAREDADGHDNFTMPREFNLDSSNGFLIARLTLRKLSSSWTLHQTVDLRGTTPQTATGGGIVTEFSDAEFVVHDDGDVTKEMVFQLSGITTGTRRTLTAPDVSGEIALLGAAGTDSITSGATSKAVSHGLSYTPTIDQIMITFAEQGTNDYGRWWVDTIGASQFTVNVSADPGASNLDFGWRVFA